MKDCLPERYHLCLYWGYLAFVRIWQAFDNPTIKVKAKLVSLFLPCIRIILSLITWSFSRAQFPWNYLLTLWAIIHINNFHVRKRKDIGKKLAIPFLLSILLLGLLICLNVKKILFQNNYDISSLSDCNETRPQNHLGRKRTLNHTAKLAIWLNGWVFVYKLSGSQFEVSCT